MFFNSNTSLEQIKHWIDSQLSAVKPIAKNGLDIEIKPHRTQRTFPVVTRVRSHTGMAADGSTGCSAAV